MLWFLFIFLIWIQIPLLKDTLLISDVLCIDWYNSEIVSYDE